MRTRDRGCEVGFIVESNRLVFSQRVMEGEKVRGNGRNQKVFSTAASEFSLILIGLKEWIEENFSVCW